MVKTTKIKSNNMLMNKFENSKIYMLYNEELDLVYYGSTTQKLNRRYNQHKNHAVRKDTKSYKLFESDTEPSLILLEELNCQNRIELHTQERKYIKNHEENNDTVIVNRNIPLRGHLEYYKDNRAKIVKRMNNYYYNNPEKMKLKGLKYYNNNKTKLLERFECECGSHYTHTHKARHLLTKKHLDGIKQI